MNKSLWIIVLLALITSFCFSNEEDAQFVLPDLFITAKDDRVLDSSQKISPKLGSGITVLDNMIDGSLQKDKAFIKTIKLSDTQSNVMYNDVSLFLGFPSLLELKLNHGYVVAKMPYFLSFSRMDNQSLYGVKNIGGSFVFTIKPDNENNISIMTKQRQLDTSNLNLFGVGYKRISDLSFGYTGRMLNANGFAGNSGIQLLEHSLDFALGEFILAGKEIDSDVSIMYLGSNVNQLFFLGIGFANVIENQDNNLDLGLQLWSNAGVQKFNFLAEHNSKFSFSSLDFTTLFQIVHEPVTLEKLYGLHFIELDDVNPFLCDERLSFRVSVDGFFEDLEETFFVDMSYYAYKNVLDDSDNDDFYTLEGFREFTVVNFGAFFPELEIASESVSVKVQYPLVSKKVPNLFNKMLEVKFEKDLLSGKFSAEGNYYLKELGRSTANDYKDGYFDVNLAYEEAISNEWSFGIYIDNLLSAGNAYLPDRNFRDTLLYGKIKVVF